MATKLLSTYIELKKAFIKDGKFEMLNTYQLAQVINSLLTLVVFSNEQKFIYGVPLE